MPFVARVADYTQTCVLDTIIQRSSAIGNSTNVQSRPIKMANISFHATDLNLLGRTLSGTFPSRCRRTFKQSLRIPELVLANS
jgi:hypothetical protein